MIGIMDSGSGGLTVMRAIREVLPSCDIVYYGDIKHAPYGPRSRRELSLLTVAAIKHLRAHKADRIVSACNSVAASLAVSLFDTVELRPEQLIEMVGPTVSYFKGIDTRIALAATAATIESGMYENAFHMIGHEPISIVIPELAGAIEFGASEAELEAMIRSALSPHLGSFDVLILACTHYPLVAPLFLNVVGEGVTVFDPAYAVAERAKKLFWPQEVGNGETKFLLTQASTRFEAYVHELFPGLKYSLEVID